MVQNVCGCNIGFCMGLLSVGCFLKTQMTQYSFWSTAMNSKVTWLPSARLQYALLLMEDIRIVDELYFVKVFEFVLSDTFLVLINVIN